MAHNSLSMCLLYTTLSYYKLVFYIKLCVYNVEVTVNWHRCVYNNNKGSIRWDI